MEMLLASSSALKVCHSKEEGLMFLKYEIAPCLIVANLLGTSKSQEARSCKPNPLHDLHIP